MPQSSFHKRIQMNDGLRTDKLDDLRNAQNVFEEAEREYQNSISKLLKTADGHLFEFDKFYYVVDSDKVEELCFKSTQIKILLDSRVPRILTEAYDFWDPKKESRYIFFTDIFASRENAQKRLIEVYEEQIEVLKEKIQDVHNQSANPIS